MERSHVGEMTAELMTADQRRAARLAVVRHATDPDDLSELLDILDLRRETGEGRADRDKRPG